MKRLRKPKLIPEARQWYKLFTVKGLAVIGVIQGVLLVTPAKWLALSVPFLSMSWTDFGAALTVAAAGITGIGRLLAQPDLREPEFEPTQPGADRELR